MDLGDVEEVEIISSCYWLDVGSEGENNYRWCLDWIIEWMVVFFIEGGDIGVVGFKENIFNLVLDVWSGFFK